MCTMGKNKGKLKKFMERKLHQQTTETVQTRAKTAGRKLRRKNLKKLQKSNNSEITAPENEVGTVQQTSDAAANSMKKRKNFDDNIYHVSYNTLKLFSKNSLFMHFFQTASD